MRRLAMALGFGLAAESLMVAVYFLLAGKASSGPGWWWTAFTLTQEPGWHLVKWWVDVVRPGFEAQVAYLYVIPIVQWLVYAGVIYALLWYRKHRPSTSN
jgi:hypothetical protein